MSEKDQFTRETDKRFTLRIDKELFERIEKCAHINRRSIGKEIETAIAMYLDYAVEMHKEGEHY